MIIWTVKKFETSPNLHLYKEEVGLAKDFPKYLGTSGPKLHVTLGDLAPLLKPGDIVHTPEWSCIIPQFRASGVN